MYLGLHLEIVITFCVYRAPSGDFDYFLNKVDCILNCLHTYKTEFIICGDINIHYLGTNNKKKQLDHLLGTYNSISTCSCQEHIYCIVTLVGSVRGIGLRYLVYCTTCGNALRRNEHVNLLF